MEGADAAQLRNLESENSRHKRLLVGANWTRGAQDGSAERALSPQARREAVEAMRAKNIHLGAQGLPRSSLQYEPVRSEQTEALTARIADLAYERLALQCASARSATGWLCPASLWINPVAPMRSGAWTFSMMPWPTVRGLRA